jgi:exosortase/archaeosortase family protein
MRDGLAAMGSAAATPRYVVSSAYAVSRGALFGGIALIGIANALTERVVAAVRFDGLPQALVTTFGVSVLVWIGAGLGISLLLRDRATPATGRDWVVAVAAAAAFLIPSSMVSWVALTGVAIYCLRVAAPGTVMRRGALIVLAIAAVRFWSHVAFALLGHYILQIDAMLVSRLVGVARAGNALQLADGSYLWIAPGCSSFTNVSLTVLCWILFAQATDRPLRRRASVWCLLAIVGVIAINAARIALIVRYPDFFQLIHGPIGATVAGWLTVATMVGFCAFGTRRDARV